MTYNLIISDTAQKQIDGAVLYLINELHSPFAAGSSKNPDAETPTS